MIDQFLERAGVLLETNRADQAEDFIRQALAEEPDNPRALAELARCLMQQEKYADALAPAQQAVAQEPDHPYYLYLLGHAYMFNNQADKAREMARSALQLAPDSADLYRLLAQLEFQESRWELALFNAEKGLEFEPDHEGLANLRTMALVKLNRTAEARDTVDSTLYKNPENPAAHANKGWVEIERGNYAEAQKSFLEALRINPNNEHAREGLKESIKAKNLLYRVVLRYFLWMSKLSEGRQWLVIIGAYVAFRLVRTVAKSNPEWQPFLMPLIVVYLFFVYSSWVAQPISNLILRIHPLGKHALTGDEKNGSTLAGLCLAAGLLCLLAGYFGSLEALVLGGGILVALLIPVGGMYSAQAGGSARRWLGIYAAVLAVAGLGGVALSALSADDTLSLMGLGVFGIGMLAYGWVANYVLMRDARRY